MSTIKIAGAPISWGVCEVPGWGFQLEPDRVLTEMRGVGLTATELGPEGFLPTDTGELKSLLAQHQLACVGGFVLRRHDCGAGDRSHGREAPFDLRQLPSRSPDDGEDDPVDGRGKCIRRRRA